MQNKDDTTHQIASKMETACLWHLPIAEEFFLRRKGLNWNHTSVSTNRIVVNRNFHINHKWLSPTIMCSNKHIIGLNCHGSFKEATLYSRV